MQNKYKLLAGSLVGAVTIHAVLAACGASMTTSANAGTDAGSGACGCTVQGPLQVVTADTDLNQLMSGTSLGPVAKIIDGPFVVTDLSAQNATLSLVLLPSAASCPAATSTPCDAGGIYGCATAANIFQTGSDPEGLLSQGFNHGRLPIPAGQMLCASIASDGSASVSWAGFKPY